MCLSIYPKKTNETYPDAISRTLHLFGAMISSCSLLRPAQWWESGLGSWLLPTSHQGHLGRQFQSLGPWQQSPVTYFHGWKCWRGKYFPCRLSLAQRNFNTLAVNRFRRRNTHYIHHSHKYVNLAKQFSLEYDPKHEKVRRCLRTACKTVTLRQEDHERESWRRMRPTEEKEERRQKWHRCAYNVRFIDWS